MKVIQELVAHFDRQKMLSRDEIRALLDQGLLAADAPVHITDLCETPGTTYYFRVFGGSDGTIWGTDVYTGDSALATSAVHAGAVKPGETSVVRVTVVTPLSQYQGSVRNGVESHDFGIYRTAYRVDPV